MIIVFCYILLLHSFLIFPFVIHLTFSITVGVQYFCYLPVLMLQSTVAVSYLHYFISFFIFRCFFFLLYFVLVILCNI